MSFNIKIRNIVVTSSLNTKIDLNKIVKNIDGVEYEPNQFPGLVMRLPKPKSACLIFTSGKLVCTGTTSIADAKIVIKKIVTKLKKLKFKIPNNYKVKLENIVASASLKRDLDVDELCFKLENTEYEPEQFPGLIYRMYDPKVTFLLFTSGNIVCTGAKTISDVKKSIIKLDKILRKL